MNHEQYNGDSHYHPEDAAARFAKNANLHMGAIGLAVGVLTGSAPLSADAGHNIGDYFAHKEHIVTTESERHGAGNETISQSSKRAAKIVGGIALMTSLFSAHEFYNQYLNNQPANLNIWAVSLELGSIALNGIVKYKNIKQPPQLIGQQHSNKHNNMDLYTSITALGGILANPFLPGIGAVVGMGISFVTANFAYELNSGKSLINHLLKR